MSQSVTVRHINWAYQLCATSKQSLLPKPSIPLDGELKIKSQKWNGNESRHYLQRARLAEAKGSRQSRVTDTWHLGQKGVALSWPCKNIYSIWSVAVWSRWSKNLPLTPPRVSIAPLGKVDPPLRSYPSEHPPQVIPKDGGKQWPQRGDKNYPTN